MSIGGSLKIIDCPEKRPRERRYNTFLGVLSLTTSLERESPMNSGDEVNSRVEKVQRFIEFLLAIHLLLT